MARYTVKIERDADDDLDFLGRKADAAVRAALARYLADQPVPGPKQKGQRKALDQNPLGAQYRLRVMDYRAYYNVDEVAHTVSVLRVRHKPRETVYLRGTPFPMRD